MTGAALRLRSLAPRLRPFVPTDRAEARALAMFLGAFAFLNLLVNLRYPGHEPPLWYLLPASDVVILLGVLALAGLHELRVPNGVLGALVVWLVVLRVLRFGDGVQQAYYEQSFSLYPDLAHATELIRFAHSTLPAWHFWALGLATAIVFLLAPLAAYRALGVAERYLRVPRRVPLVGLLVAASFVAGLPLSHDPRHHQLVAGGFGSSSIPRVRREAEFLVNLYASRSLRLGAIRDAQRRLAELPANLERLGGESVLLVLVESYGDALFERPDFARAFVPRVERMEKELGELGFAIATGRLESSTYGGRSWLAHATLGAGVRITDQLGYDLLATAAPKTLAGYFRDAGYRTVLVNPGTTRPWPKGEFYRFEQKYFAWDFDYAGPPFGWATMPDQYVLDFIHRREVARRPERLFVQYVLVTSHAPWSEVPTVVEDWSRVGRGALFDTQPVHRFDVDWPDFTNGSEAYLRSIEYDFEVIRRYLAEFIRGDSLVVVMGDHQPVAQVSGGSTSRTVPVHVFCRKRALVEPFLARGYVPGMRPRIPGPARGMETFLADLLRDFSKD